MSAEASHVHEARSLDAADVDGARAPPRTMRRRPDVALGDAQGLGQVAPGPAGDEAEADAVRGARLQDPVGHPAPGPVAAHGHDGGEPAGHGLAGQAGLVPGAGRQSVLDRSARGQGGQDGIHQA
jgi:hypothetical protein